MNWGSTTMKDEAGEGSITMALYAWQPTHFWLPSELGFPPLSLLPSSARLAYPNVSPHEALPLRVERHNPASITTMRLRQARNLTACLPACPWCGQADVGLFLTQ